MSPNSIKLLTGNGHPDLAMRVADRYVESLWALFCCRHRGGILFKEHGGASDETPAYAYRWPTAPVEMCR